MQGERATCTWLWSPAGRPDVDRQRIGAIGLSVGGEMLIEASAESSALKAIVSEGASGRSVRDDLANPGGKWQNVLGDGIATVGTALFTSNVPPADLKSLVPNMRSRAVFFVYGEKGQPVEKPANTAFYKVARGPKAIWDGPGFGPHRRDRARPAEYERRVVGFFDRTLLGR